jgi:hypothetical protein
LVLVLWIAFGGLGGCFPHFGNPFRTETVDRSSPVVLKSIENMRRFQAASGHFEVIVDLEKDTRFVPAVLRGERVLFVAVGNVDAGVDFTNLEEDAVEVSNGRRKVVLELPHAQLFSARIDPEQSYVYDRDRGLIDRVASSSRTTRRASGSSTGRARRSFVRQRRRTRASSRGRSSTHGGC